MKGVLNLALRLITSSVSKLRVAIGVNVLLASFAVLHLIVAYLGGLMYIVEGHI